MKSQIRKIIAPVFHFIALFHHCVALIYPLKEIDIFQITDEEVLHIIKFAPVFFTTWNILLQIAYFSMALYSEILEFRNIKPEVRSKIEQYKGYIFNSLLFPFSIFVVTVFWGVYSVDRELVLPEVLDAYIPRWLNHSFHTNILLFVIIEVLMANQLMPTFKSAFIGLTVVSGTYQILFILAHFAYGNWPYGLFYLFNWPERILFLFSNYIFTVIMMKLGMLIQNFKHNLSRREGLKFHKIN